MSTAASVTGLGQGSALKAGQKGRLDDLVGVERLLGAHIVRCDTITLSTGNGLYTFPASLNGTATDYVVLANAAHAVYAPTVTLSTASFNGTGSDVVSFVVVKRTTSASA